MHLDEATHIVSRLKDAFPAMPLDEGQSEVLIRELALLHDARMLDMAVTNLIRRDERFPTIARIRGEYRTLNEANAAAKAALERAAVPRAEGGAPEWVAVWSWWRGKTHDARVEANPANKGRRVEDRLPLVMRSFPQCAHLDSANDPPAYSVEEYDRIRAAWVEAGSPEFGGVVGLVCELVGATA